MASWSHPKPIRALIAQARWRRHKRPAVRIVKPGALSPDSGPEGPPPTHVRVEPTGKRAA